MDFFRKIVELAFLLRAKNKEYENENRIRTAKKFLVSVTQNNFSFQVVVDAINAGSARIVAQQMFPKGRVNSIVDFKK